MGKSSPMELNCAIHCYEVKLNFSHHAISEEDKYNTIKLIITLSATVPMIGNIIQ